MSEASRAADRLRAALADKPRGFRGPNEEQHHVAVSAGDLAIVCQAAPGDLATHFLKAVAGMKPKTEVVIQADDAHAILEKVKDEPAPTKS